MKTGIFDNQEKLTLVIEKDHSNIFVFISKKHFFLRKLMEVLNNSTYRKRILILYNYYYPIRNIIDKLINNIIEINFPLYVVNALTKNTLKEAMDFCSNMNDTVYEIKKRVKVFKNQLPSSNTQSKETRNLDRSFSMRFISSILHWLEYPRTFSVEVKHIASSIAMKKI